MALSVNDATSSKLLGAPSLSTSALNCLQIVLACDWKSDLERASPPPPPPPPQPATARAAAARTGETMRVGLIMATTLALHARVQLGLASQVVGRRSGPGGVGQQALD